MMELAEFREDIPILLDSWFEGIAPQAAKDAGLAINRSWYDNIALMAHSVAGKLYDALVDSDGIDEHKIAAVEAFAVASNSRLNLFTFPSTGEWTTAKGKDNICTDCALSTYLYLLDVDRDAIVSEPITNETLRKMFLEMTRVRVPHDVQIPFLLSLSTTAFALEKVYSSSVPL